MTNQTDDFWDSIVPPFQEEDQDYNFANLISAARHIYKANAAASELGGKAEILTKAIAEKQVELDRVERDLTILRRKTLSVHYDKITKSAGSDIQEAFLLKCIAGTPDEPHFQALEIKREELCRFIEERQPTLARIKGRLKALESMVERTDKYLNVEKLLVRVEAKK